MKAWLAILAEVLETGENRPDRTGVGTRSVFGLVCRFNNSGDNFPAVTTKKLFMRQVAAELTGFLAGATTLEEFHKYGCTIWDANTAAPAWQDKVNDPNYVGRIYGAQWRNWLHVDLIARPLSVGVTDQLRDLVHNLKTDPMSRRHVVTAYNPGELGDMCLPPCHLMFQCYVRTDKTLDMVVYMRSVDLFIGLPFDIASYALLQRILAQQTGLNSGELTFMLGDAHIYNNHIAQVETVLQRTPLAAPGIKIDATATINNFDSSMFELIGYSNHGAVTAPMNV
jgi:thymidylate synthase